MIIYNWIECPEDIRPSTGTFYLRTTPVYRGSVIDINDERNLFMTSGTPEFDSRRYSVVEIIDDDIFLHIGAVTYVTPFDSNNDFEAHRKYVNDEWTNLMTVAYDDSIEDALTWTGQATTITTS